MQTSCVEQISTHKPFVDMILIINKCEFGGSFDDITNIEKFVLHIN